MFPPSIVVILVPSDCLKVPPVKVTTPSKFILFTTLLYATDIVLEPAEDSVP